MRRIMRFRQALLFADTKPIDADLIQESGMRAASWLVAGFAVMADWIGSNQDWFPYADPNLRLPDYWQKAREKAEAAVAKAGLVRRCGPLLWAARCA